MKMSTHLPESLGEGERVKCDVLVSCRSQVCVAGVGRGERPLCLWLK